MKSTPESGPDCIVAATAAYAFISSVCDAPGMPDVGAAPPVWRHPNGTIGNQRVVGTAPPSYRIGNVP
jgi:hypothetical protein